MRHPLRPSLLRATTPSAMPPPMPKRSQAPLVVPAPAPVPVTLAVMSRCPDAHFCEAVFDHVLPLVPADHIDLGFIYIGSPDPSATYGVRCMHGDAECRGNIHQLCAAQALRNTPHANRRMLDFVLCSNSDKDTIGEDAAAAQCWAQTQRQDYGTHTPVPAWRDVQSCIDEPAQGQALLLQSVTETTRRSVRSSCTVLLDHISPSCVRDGGVWRDCPPGVGTEPEDFARQIETAWGTARIPPLAPAPRKLWNAVATPSYHLLKRQGPGSEPASPAADPSQSPVAPVGSTTAAPSSGSSSDNEGHKSSGTNPSIFTFVIAIALFAIVVGFAVIRLLYRRRHGQSFFGSRRPAPAATRGTAAGGAVHGEGTGAGPNMGGNDNTPRSAIVTVDDPLKPPKLWDAKVADFDALSKLGYAYPEATEKDAGKHAWDRIMPVAAALSPQLYPILFADQDNKGNTTSTPVHATGDVRRRIKSFRSSSGPDPVSVSGAPGSDDDAGNEPTSASVNVTVLIAMPNVSTVVPSSSFGPPAVSARVQMLQAEAGAAPSVSASKMVRHASIRSTRSNRSIRSTRTSASARSVASARRSAFFGPDYDPTIDPAADKDDKNKEKMRVDVVDMPAGRLSDAGSSSEDDKPDDDDDDDDDDDPEVDGVLPELMFGTASVPIYTLHSNSSTNRFPSRSGSGVYTGGFTYSSRAPPTRNELHALLARAQDVRENKPLPPMNIAASTGELTAKQTGTHLAPPQAGLLHRTPSVSSPLAPARSAVGSVRSTAHPLATSPPPLAASPPPMSAGATALQSHTTPLQPPASPARRAGSGHESPAPLAFPALSPSPLPNPWNSSPSPSPIAPSLSAGVPQRTASGAPAPDLRVVEEEPPSPPPAASTTSPPPLARPTPTPAQPKPDADLDWLGTLSHI